MTNETDDNVGYDALYKETLKTIDDDVKNTQILLFMKGTKTMPLCGFSGRVVEILHEIDCEFETRNVLDDEVLREAVKEYSDWPTLPQLYINGTFIGGCDIITQMFESGDLKKIIDE